MTGPGLDPAQTGAIEARVALGWSLWRISRDVGCGIPTVRLVRARMEQRAPVVPRVHRAVERATARAAIVAGIAQHWPNWRIARAADCSESLVRTVRKELAASPPDGAEGGARFR